jgi:hypothetical protein
MRSIPLAMTWELLNHRPWILLAGALGANLLPWMLLTALHQEGGIIPTHPSMIIVHMCLIQMQLFTIGVAVFASQGNPARLYPWPVSTATIVTWHLLPAMAITAAASLIGTLALNAVFQVGWPLWGPAMFVAVTVAAIQAVSWLTEKSAWFVVGLTAVAGTLGIWFKSRYGAPFSQPDHYWLGVEPGEVATMIGFAMVAFATAIVAVGRNRRSEPPITLGIIARLNSIPAQFPDLLRSFRTATQAQTWFEWRQKGWAMPTAVLGSLSLGGGSWLLFGRDPEPLFDAMVVAGGMLPVLGALCGLLMGNCGAQDGNLEMGPFLATRPLTIPDWSRILLQVSARSVLAAWSIWALVFAAVSLMLFVNGASLKSEMSIVFKWWYFPATLVSSWTVVAVGAAISMTGRSALLAKLLTGLIGTWLALLLTIKFGLSEQAQAQFVHGATAMCGVASLLATVWLYFAASRRRLIRRLTVYLAAGTWGVLAVLVAIAWQQEAGATLSGLTLLLGLTALTVAPLAAAPLALAWNRNR